MATTRRDKVGTVRIRLAEILSTKLGFKVAPEDLQSQVPFYARPEVDACSWCANVWDGGSRRVHLCSWHTMTECVRFGIELLRDRGAAEAYEVLCGDKPDKE